MDTSRLCLGTSVLIAYLKKREPATSAVRRAMQERDRYVTAITVYELLFDESAARRAANLQADLIHRNQDIGVKDVLIAAICLESSLPLLTLNERHFARVPELRVLTPDNLVARER